MSIDWIEELDRLLKYIKPFPLMASRGESFNYFLIDFLPCKYFLNKFMLSTTTINYQVFSNTIMFTL